MRSDASKPDSGPGHQDPPTFTPRTEFGDQSTKSKVVGRPECPSEETLILLAAGVDDAATRAAAVHAAVCAMCKSQLALLVRDEHFVAGVRGMISAPLTGPGAGRGEEYRRREEESEAFILPGYAVEGEIHRGGQGIVYRAIQLDTKRAVAVKMLLRGAFATPRELRRFEREVEIAASLRHPHIVTIYDNITLDDGRSALAMELVEGVTIDAWARGRVKGEPDRQPRTIKERAAMVAAIARAVQYAHNRAIIHRDLKPANVLVDAEDQPHVLDFGLARRTIVDHETSMLSGAAPKEASILVSLAGIFNGTPAYASPEQLSGDPLLVDTRCDVYSLGIMLYELVTGRLPTSFDGALPGVKTEEDGIAAIISKKTSGRFPTPMEAAEITKSPRVDVDLDSIVMKAMAVDKDARYQTADRFAADIDRYLAGEAVAARSGERWYRVRKTVRKYRKSLGAGATVLVALLAFGVYYAVLAARLDENSVRLAEQTRTLARQRDEIIARRDTLGTELDRSEVRLARAELQLGSVQRAQAALSTVIRGKPDLAAALDSSGADGAPDVLRAYWALWEMVAASRERSSVAVQDELNLGPGLDSSTFRSVSSDGRVEEWTLPGLSRRHVFTFDGFKGVQSGVSYFDLDLVLNSSPNSASAWRIGTSGPIRSWPSLSSGSIHLLPGTRCVVYVNEMRQVIKEPIDPRDGAPVVLFENGPDPRTARWATSGRAVGVQDVRDGVATIRLWLISSGTTHSIVLPGKFVPAVARGASVSQIEVDPRDGTVALHWSNQVFLWDVASKRLTEVPTVVNEKASALRFGPSGKTVVLSQSSTGRTLVSKLSAGAAEMTPPYFLEVYSGIPILNGSEPPEGEQWLATATSGLVKVWDIRTSEWGREIGDESPTKPAPNDPFTRSVHCTAFSPDSSMLCSGSNQGIITIWKGAEPPRDIVTSQRGVTPTVARIISDLAFSPDSRLLASTGYDGTVRVFDAQTLDTLTTLSTGEYRATAAIFTPDGSSIIYGTGIHSRYNLPESGNIIDTGGEVLRWDYTSPTSSKTPVLLWKHRLRIAKIVRQPGGPLVASLSPDHTVKIGAPDSTVAPMTLQHKIHPRCMAFSPNGNLLATGADDHIIRLWDVRTGKVAKQWASYTGTCSDMAFHPRPAGDGVLLFTLYREGKLYIWDTRTGEQIATFVTHALDRGMSLNIAPDAGRFVTAGLDGTLKTWDLSWYAPHVRSTIDFWRQSPAPPPGDFPVR